MCFVSNGPGMKDIYTSTDQRLGLLEALLKHFGLNTSEILEFKHHALSMEGKAFKGEDTHFKITNSSSPAQDNDGKLHCFKYCVLC